MPRRLDEARRAELLDGLMSLVVARGFSKVSTSEMATELQCSVRTLYKLAPSKEKIVLLAIERWAGDVFLDMEGQAQECATASDRARTYFLVGTEKLRPISLAFFVDVQNSELVREVWRTTVVDPYIDRFVELLEQAEAAGEVRPVNIRFLGEVLRAIGFVTRDERALSAAGLTSEEAVLEVDRLIWNGIIQEQA